MTLSGAELQQFAIRFRELSSEFNVDMIYTSRMESLIEGLIDQSLRKDDVILKIILDDTKPGMTGVFVDSKVPKVDDPKKQMVIMTGILKALETLQGEMSKSANNFAKESGMEWVSKRNPGSIGPEILGGGLLQAVFSEKSPAEIADMHKKIKSFDKNEGEQFVKEMKSFIERMIKGC